MFFLYYEIFLTKGISFRGMVNFQIVQMLSSRNNNAHPVTIIWGIGTVTTSQPKLMMIKVSIIKATDKSHENCLTCIWGSLKKGNLNYLFNNNELQTAVTQWTIDHLLCNYHNFHEHNMNNIPWLCVQFIKCTCSAYTV